MDVLPNFKVFQYLLMQNKYYLLLFIKKDELYFLYKHGCWISVVSEMLCCPCFSGKQ